MALLSPVCALALILSALAPIPSSAERSGRYASKHKLIEWGWDQPATAYLREHIATMEQAPFDGVVLTVLGSDHGKPIDFQWQTWGKQAFTREQFAQAVADLRATKFHRFTDNFLRFNATPGDVDWFDDSGWQAICANGALAAWICKEGRLKGLMFDTEQYNTPPFDYSKQKEKRPFDAYAAQARQRGRELARAMTAVKPDLTILYTFADSLLTLSPEGPLPEAAYGLLPAFLDGMLEGAGRHAAFYDALEMAYPTRERSRFEQLKQAVQAAKRLSSVPILYAARMRTGFGLWMDHDWRRHGWDPISTAGNYFQPDELRQALESALATTDKYVWLYSEQLNWWTGKGLSPAYVQAVQAGRK